MGTYLHPGNRGFAEIRRSDYVDKTGLISLINHSIGTTNKLTCISRPRRFGKSYAAKALCAYYDQSCDSHDLFSGYQIASDPTFEDHLNRYQVISLDISGFISDARTNHTPIGEVPLAIKQAILKEVQSLYPELASVGHLNDCLLELVRKTGTQIIFIIDEWDAMIRDAKDEEDAQRSYLNLLRSWFKNNNFTPDAVAAAYMTGILPIKKDGTQSAISDFDEHTRLIPGPLGNMSDSQSRKSGRSVMNGESVL